MSEPPIVPRLLAGRDRLSRIEKDAIFEQVMATLPAPRRSRWWLTVAVPALAVIALVAWRVRATPEVVSEFASRGGTGPVATMHVTCGACTSRDKLVFDVHGTTGYRYFAAFAQRADGTVLWYFPATADATSLDLATQPASGILGVAITLGADHPPGAYRVFGVFSHAPLARDALRDRFDPAALSAGPNTRVIATEVVVP